MYANDPFSVGITCYSAVIHWAAQVSDPGLLAKLYAAWTVFFSQPSPALLANCDSLPLRSKSVRSVGIYSIT